MIQPIWKNYIVNLGNAESVEYVIGYIKDNSFNAIYSGRAWKRPGEESTIISINDICADWLSLTFPTLVNGFDPSQMPVTFAVQTISETGIYTQVDEVRFVNDWSYDPQHDAKKDGVSSPVNGILDRRQWLLWTGIDVAVVNVVVTLADGQTIQESVSLGSFGDFSNDFSSDFAASLASAGSGTFVKAVSQWGDVAKVSVNGVQYSVIDSCAKYVLYYRNAYGGWDSFLIEGAASEEDALTRLSLDKSGVYEREKTNYLNEIQKKLTLHTSWLSDGQSLKMHHLLNSTDVYLHDLDNDVILPVILDNSSTPYKTYKGEGARLVNYTIEATIAQSRRRR